jgi:primosomal protein N' (replication factor Y)
VRSYGVGTERLEDEISKIFPLARLARMDSDTTAKRGTQEKILHALDRGEIDILIGTQMIAKGHDYPNVLLVGVIMADASLNIPDFRAAESTFQLLTQVSGRGGRGDDPGRVIIQTYNPEHYAIRLAQTQDYDKFYEEEISLRRAVGYPPFSRMVNVHLSCLRKEDGEAGAKKIAAIAKSLSASLKGGERVDVIGPAESPIPKIKGRYRWQLILKGGSIKILHRMAKGILAQGSEKGMNIRLDVDPVNFI